MTLQKELEALIRQLEQLGYQPYQIDGIIEEAAGTIHWKGVPPAIQQELIKSLENQICFADCCLKWNKYGGHS